MADSGNRKSAPRRQPNRLQKRAPASLQISPAAEWKAAIPLLSPLVQSPASDDSPVEVRSCPNGANEPSAAAAEKPVVVTRGEEGRRRWKEKIERWRIVGIKHWNQAKPM